MTRVELIRASAQTALLRVDVTGLPTDPLPGVALVARRANEPARRIAPLPIPPGSSGSVRFAFGMPVALRLARLTLAVGGDELGLAVPPERSREDAVTSVALREARARVADLERALAERDSAQDADAGEDDAALRRRLEEQLAEHRLLRAQLTRELRTARERGQEIARALEQAQAERDHLESALESERTGSTAEQERLAGRLEQARQRVEYLERRVVEVQAQARRRQRT